MTKLPRVMANVPKDLYKKLKVRAKKEKTTMSKFIVLLLKASLFFVLMLLPQLGMSQIVLTEAQTQKVLANAPQYVPEVDSIY